MKRIFVIIKNYCLDTAWKVLEERGCQRWDGVPLDDNLTKADYYKSFYVDTFMAFICMLTDYALPTLDKAIEHMRKITQDCSRRTIDVSDDLEAAIELMTQARNFETRFEKILEEPSDIKSTYSGIYNTFRAEDLQALRDAKVEFRTLSYECALHIAKKPEGVVKLVSEEPYFY